MNYGIKTYDGGFVGHIGGGGRVWVTSDRENGRWMDPKELLFEIYEAIDGPYKVRDEAETVCRNLNGYLT